MTLLADVSRCPGTKQPVCANCLRMTDKRGDRVITTAWVPVKGHCKHKIKEQEITHKEML